ncbi:hypothetical protein [Streptomyces sp. NPDC046870]|uniref:hypothetical protein n=1 Tax=Streptomyces sp. NPDC046870 TaxID=3155135 RepID=UPI003456B3E5
MTGGLTVQGAKLTIADLARRGNPLCVGAITEPVGRAVVTLDAQKQEVELINAWMMRLLCHLNLSKNRLRAP